MHAVKSNTRRRRLPASWGAMHWLILGLLALCFAASSGCATVRTPPRVSHAQAVTPHVELTSDQRSGHDCDGLRGRLPVVDGLSVGDLSAGWTDATAFGTCQADRADQLVGIIDRLNAEWARYAASH